MQSAAAGTDTAAVRARPAPASARRGERGAFRTVLTNRQFARVLASDTISGTGDVLYWIALIVLLHRRGGGGLVALAAIVRLVPRMAFGAFGGVIADRHDRRRLLMVLDGTRGVVMVGLAVTAAWDGPTAVVLGLVFVLCALGTPYRPALAAGYPMLLPEDQLAAANALSNSVAQLTTLVGPLLGAALLAGGSPTMAFAIDAATFAAAVALMSGVTGLGSAARTGSHVGAGHGEPRGWRHEVGAGARAVRDQPAVAALVLLIGAAALLRGLELVLHVQVAEALLDLGPSGYGIVSGALGAGAICAVPFTSRLARSRRPGLVIVASSLAGCATIGLLATTDRVPVAMVLLGLEGASIVCFEVLALTMLQRVCRLDVLGRVLGLQNTFAGTAKLVGSVVAPALLAAGGVRVAVVGAAALAALPVALLAPRIAAAARDAAGVADRLAPVVDTLVQLRLFEGTPRPALERLARQVAEESVGPGTVVMREGDTALDLYVVRRGHLVVSASGRTINELGPGDWFGEIGLLRRSPRTATVVAEEPTDLWRLDGAAFVAAVTSSSTLPEALSTDVAQRLARSEAAAASAAAAESADAVAARAGDARAGGTRTHDGAEGPDADG